MPTSSASSANDGEEMTIDAEWLSTGTALVERSSGTILQCNAAFRTLLPVAPGDALWSALGVAPFENHRQRVRGSTSATAAAAVPNGSEPAAGAFQQWFDVRTRVVRAGASLFVELSDVSGLVDAENQAKAFLEMSFDGYFDWHINDDYEYMSPRFWEIFGYKPEEKEHKPSAWQGMIFQEDLPQVMRNFNAHVGSHGALPYVQDARYRHKDGSTVVVTCQGRVIEWDEDTGAPLRMIGTHTDVTEVRQKSRADTERRMNDYLAHEVRNPLTSAVMATRFLHTALDNATWEDGAVAQQAHHDAELLHDNLLAISALIGRLVELHKIYGNDVAFSLAPTCLATEVLQPVRRMLLEPEPLANGEPGLTKVSLRLPPHVTVHMTCPEDFKANIDALRVKQVLFRTMCHAGNRLRSGFVRASVEPPKPDSGGREFTVLIEAFGEPAQRLGTAAVDLMGVNAGAAAPDATGSRNSRNDINAPDSFHGSGNKIQPGTGSTGGDGDLMMGLLSDGVRQSTDGPNPAVHVARTLAVAMGGSLEQEMYEPGVNGEGENAGSDPPRARQYYVIKLPGALVAGSSSITSASSANMTDFDEAGEDCDTAPTAGASSSKAGTPREATSTVTPTTSTTSSSSSSSSSASVATTVRIDPYYVGSRVMVIDDEPIIRKLVPRRLRALIPGVIVDCAASGEEALELARKHSYSLFMVDHYMPGPHRPLTGAQTICQLRLLGVEAAIVGCSGNDVSVQHAEAGANGFILKPTPPNAKFVRILNSVVPRRKLNQLNLSLHQQQQRRQQTHHRNDVVTSPSASTTAGGLPSDSRSGNDDVASVDFASAEVAVSESTTSTWITDISDGDSGAPAPLKATTSPGWISTSSSNSVAGAVELPASSPTPSWIQGGSGSTGAHVASSSPSWIQGPGATTSSTAAEATRANGGTAAASSTPSWINNGGGT